MTEIMIETKKLILKTLSRDNFTDFQMQQKDPDFMKFFGGPRDDVTIESVFRFLYEHLRQHGFSQGMVFEKKTGICIGRAGLTYVELTPPDVEFSVFLLPHYWRQGYGLELSLTLIDYAFTVLNLPSLYATVSPDNAAACSGCEYLGMTLEREAIYENPVFKKKVRYYRLDRS